MLNEPVEPAPHPGPARFFAGPWADLDHTPQEDGPVNALAKMYVEIDGKQLRSGASHLRRGDEIVSGRSFVGDPLRTTI